MLKAKPAALFPGLSRRVPVLKCSVVTSRIVAPRHSEATNHNLPLSVGTDLLSTAVAMAKTPRNMAPTLRQSACFCI